MEGKTSAAIIGEFGVTCQVDQNTKENAKELKKKLLEENLITSLDDKLIFIDPTDAKEIREGHIDKAPDKFFVFNKQLCGKDSVERIYEEQIFKIKKLTLEDLKENQSIEEVISNQWNFKPLLSLSEDIDFQKVQQFEQYTFQIYKSILDSYVNFKSKQSWCAKAIEEIQMQEV